MFVYLFLLIVFFANYIISKQTKFHGTDKSLVVSVIFVLSAIASLRYDVGVDYLTYKDIFVEVNSGANFSELNIEMGYWLLNKLIFVIGGNYQAVFMIMATISYVFFYKFMSFFSTSLFFSLLIFICIGQLYLNSFNAVRQFLAMAIFAYSTIYIVQRKFLKYSMGIIFAAFFGHTSIILLLACYPLAKGINMYVKSIIFVLVVAFYKVIVTVLESSEKYMVYLKMVEFTREVTLITYLYLVFSFFVLLRGNSILSDYKYKNLVLNMNFCFFLLCIMMILFSNSPVIELVNRFSYYFIIFFIILIPALVTNIYNFRYRFIAKVIISIFLVLLFLRASILLGDQYNLLPFKFSFEFIR